MTARVTSVAAAGDTAGVELVLQHHRGADGDAGGADRLVLEVGAAAVRHALLS